MSKGAWLGVIGALSIGVCALYVWQALNAPFSLTVVITNALAVAFVPMLSFLALYDTTGRQVIPNLFAIVIGMLTGWALSIFWVPYDSIDAKIYSQIGTAVTFAVSGYLFAKFDKVITQAWGGPATPVPTYLVHAVLLGLSTMVLTTIVITTNRIEYLQSQSQRVAVVIATERKAHEELVLAAAKYQFAIEALTAASAGHPRVVSHRERAMPR